MSFWGLGVRRGDLTFIESLQTDLADLTIHGLYWVSRTFLSSHYETKSSSGLEGVVQYPSPGWLAANVRPESSR